MKTLMTDAIGLAGFGSLAAGVYLKFGLASSLIMSGSLLLLYALVVAMRGKMLLDALFRNEPLENPSTPITGESAETDNILPAMFCQPRNCDETGGCLRLYLCYFLKYCTDAATCDEENQ